jgi:lipopolysaccharide assembly outer membrane protein LptD (OstA)
MAGKVEGKEKRSGETEHRRKLACCKPEGNQGSVRKFFALSFALMVALLALSVGFSFPQQNLTVPPAPSENLLQVESDLPIRYFPEEREWRTLDGTGTIKIKFRELTIFARKARYSEREQILEAQEGLRAIWQDGVEFEGGRARYFVNERRWIVEGGKATFDPSYFGEGVAAPLYLTLQSMGGTDERLTAERGTFSSCDRPHPHYSLRAQSAEAMPGDRLILRRVGIYIGETKVAWNRSLHRFPETEKASKPTANHARCGQ